MMKCACINCLLLGLSTIGKGTAQQAIEIAAVVNILPVLDLLWLPASGLASMRWYDVSALSMESNVRFILEKCLQHCWGESSATGRSHLRGLP